MSHNHFPSPDPPDSPESVAVAVITCAVLEDEVNHFVQHCPNVCHVEMLAQGLHNEPKRLRVKLQQAIDHVEATVTQAQAIVLGYGLCSRGTEGVYTSRCRLVMPRAHDCITLLLGDRGRYADYVRENPGTYWYSPGWNKHHLPPGKQRYEKLHREYTEKFGADNAEYLMESEQHWFSTYERATYVDLTIGVTDADLKYTRQCADWLKWNFDHQHGDPDLLKSLLSGPWDDERFLVLEPGQSFTIAANADADRIIRRNDAAAPSLSKASPKT